MNDYCYIVVEDYQSQFSDPIQLEKNEVVKVGERYTGDVEWSGWVLCEKEGGKSGWVLERVLEINEDKAVVIENYNGNELTVQKGEKLFPLKAEAGWIWCVNSQKETGWVPLRNVKLIPGE